ncbi:uncharacterized protein I303_106844 [Kwoniella dejecticola CBS 10117]|uniref:FHA domain-containing protein n=1 Tax=Kwoniella dejecticola CBS 10117 TaxID=1296121 RepID=A0A1A5ZTJ8_9TREE|nr:uncharacterized protein I303_08515 [Kwoniella dejecticola CBS 10117]OBR81132.1 hypothetical protein I303_08515 [Kwoniella dejecticola CBS 10117]
MSVNSASLTPASRPLETLKRIPASKMSTPSAKRARVSTFQKPMTPHPSSDFEVESEIEEAQQTLKFTAVPIRILNGEPMTPSTSTVAFSSSPNRRMMMSSSPIKAARSQSINNWTLDQLEQLDHDITLQEGESLIFGRHRHSHSTSNESSSSSSAISSTIPSHLVPLLAHPENPSSVIHLSKHASHASRVHAAVELIKSAEAGTKDIVRILVIGQNGMKVKITNKKRGVRLLQGQKYDLALAAHQTAELDFFGSKVLLRIPSPVSVLHADDSERQDNERLFSSSPVSQRQELQHLASSMPPSSPPVVPMESDDEELSDLEPESHVETNSPQIRIPALSLNLALEKEKEAETAEDRLSRASSPLSPASEPRLSPLPEVAPEEQQQCLPEPEEAQQEEQAEKQVKAELIEIATVKAPSRASSPILPVPAEVDLQAIIASTVVFSGSSKLSLPDLVKHMLESQPSLKDHGSEKNWSAWVGDALENNEMFGKVERHGKDASGHPLLPHYYYNPAADPDTSRATELGALVRPLRTAQRTGGKVIDWRPVGRGRRHM